MIIPHKLQTAFEGTVEGKSSIAFVQTLFLSNIQWLVVRTMFLCFIAIFCCNSFGNSRTCDDQLCKSCQQVWQPHQTWLRAEHPYLDVLSQEEEFCPFDYSRGLSLCCSNAHILNVGTMSTWVKQMHPLMHLAEQLYQGEVTHLNSKDIKSLAHFCIICAQSGLLSPYYYLCAVKSNHSISI